jgi:hypothetical protein
MTENDIGLLKLMSVSARANKKDVYHLEYLTDCTSLVDLYTKLKYKKETFNSNADRTIFDLDNNESPVDNVELLLKFDTEQRDDKSMPSHTNDRIFILPVKRTGRRHGRAGEGK